MILFFNNQAKEWTEALPIGNGSMGGMVYGGKNKDKISLNEDTLWSGYPKDYTNKNALSHLEKIRSMIFTGDIKEAQELLEKECLGDFTEAYQPLGDLNIKFNNKHIKNYKRQLDLSSGIVNVSYLSDNCRINREYYCSYIDKCMVVSIKSEMHNLDIELSAESQLKHKTYYEDGQLLLEGVCPDVSLPAYLRRKDGVKYDDNNAMAFSYLADVATDGKINYHPQGIKITDASYINIVAVSGTGFIKYDKMPINNPYIITDKLKQRLIKLKSYTIDEIKNKHIIDYKSLYNRTSFSINGISDNSLIDVDKELKLIKKGKDSGTLATVYLNYAKMLYITGSREGTQPLNLQGIWNNILTPPWSSNYTVNINTEMNYWLVNQLGLYECFSPMAELIREISERSAEVSLNQYGIAGGFVCNHNTDIWRMPTPTGGDSCYAYFPLAGGWLATHIYDYYEYTLDTEFLKKHFSIIEAAAIFCLNWLVEHNGTLTVCPSTSAENKFRYKDSTLSVAYGSAVDLGIIKQVFSDYLNASLALDIDNELREKVLESIDKIAPFNIGSDKCITEWQEEYEEVEKGHRHFSPAISLHPFSVVQYYKDRNMVRAIENLLDKRCKYGSGHTGWSASWLISMYARLHREQDCKFFIDKLFTDSTYPNLFDKHPPFQIDGNFGAPHGFIEMLFQYEQGIIELMPACLKEWKDGKFCGVKIKEGYTIDMEWENNRVKYINVLSIKNDYINIRYKGQITQYKLTQGIPTTINID